MFRSRCENDTSIIDRLEFWSIPEPNSGCQLWLGCVDDKGYGRIKVDGLVDRCHRVSWRVHNGEIPDGKQILHHCDIRSCINYLHLFVGTHQDNMDDMVSKGRARSPRGVKNKKAKLNEIAVMEIISDNRSHVKIAKDFGVSQVQVSNIKRGVSWSHISGVIR